MKKPSIKNILIILVIVLALFGIYSFAHFAYVASAMWEDGKAFKFQFNPHAPWLALKIVILSLQRQQQIL